MDLKKKVRLRPIFDLLLLLTLALRRNGPKEKGEIETSEQNVNACNIYICRNGPKEEGGIETLLGRRHSEYTLK